MNDLLNKVKETIVKHKLIEDGDSVLVGLSGGADSVCLLFCLKELSAELGITVSAAHLNHCLRGKAADDDEIYSAELCRKWDIPFFALKKDIRADSRKNGVGLEEAGRMARYDFFSDLQKKHGFSKIATAHHGNDNVETVLMRLIRGTGPLGLGGIPYQNGTVIRPLLDVTRKDIESFLDKEEIKFRIDASNQDTVYTRNRIRNLLIPDIEQNFNPNFQKTLQEEIRLYQSFASFVKDEADMVIKENCFAVPGGYAITCDALSALHAFMTGTVIQQILMKLYPKKELNHSHIEEILSVVQKRIGRISLPDGMIAEVCYGVLYLRRNVDCAGFDGVELKPGIVLPLWDGKKLSCSVVHCDVLASNKNSVLFETEKISGKSVFLRSRRDGDVFFPNGMKGKKKLQDFFVDEKVPYFMRDFVPLVTVGDEIAWVVGFRGDRRFVASEKRDSYFCITVELGEEK